MKGFGFRSDDKFYNRRKLAIWSLAYAVGWGFVVLIADVCFGFDAVKVSAYLGYTTAVCALPTWQYLKACLKDDESKKNEQSTPNSDS